MGAYNSVWLQGDKCGAWISKSSVIIKTEIREEKRTTVHVPSENYTKECNTEEGQIYVKYCEKKYKEVFVTEKNKVYLYLYIIGYEYPLKIEFDNMENANKEKERFLKIKDG